MFTKKRKFPRNIILPSMPFFHVLFIIGLVFDVHELRYCYYLETILVAVVAVVAVIAVVAVVVAADAAVAAAADVISE